MSETWAIFVENIEWMDGDFIHSLWFLESHINKFFDADTMKRSQLIFSRVWGLWVRHFPLKRRLVPLNGMTLSWLSNLRNKVSLMYHNGLQNYQSLKVNCSLKLVRLVIKNVLINSKFPSLQSFRRLSNQKKAMNEMLILHQGFFPRDWHNEHDMGKTKW